MQPNELIEWIVDDPIAVILYYIIVLLVIFGLDRKAVGQGNVPPYDKIYTVLVHLLCVPGVLSITLWGYSMLFEAKSLTQLDPFAYYLPVIAMAIGLSVIKRNAILKNLPWFGKMNELFALISISFICLLFVMEKAFFPIESVWIAFALAGIFFILFKLVWVRFQRTMRARNRF